MFLLLMIGIGWLALNVLALVFIQITRREWPDMDTSNDIHSV